jgi:hypothetical protein
MQFIYFLINYPSAELRGILLIKMLPPVVEALRGQRKASLGKSDYVFLNRYKRPMTLPCQEKGD